MLVSLPGNCSRHSLVLWSVSYYNTNVLHLTFIDDFIKNLIPQIIRAQYILNIVFCFFSVYKEWRIHHSTLFSCLFIFIIFKVGDRCEVDPGAKRGVVKYMGRAESLAPGFWVGIQYDEPLGKHDGM